LGTTFYVSLSIPFGRISDRIGRTKMLYGSCILLATVNLLIPLFYRSAFSIALMVPIIGASQALFWPIYEAWFSERSGGGDLLKRIQIFNLFWSTGIMLGPFAAGHLYEWNRFIPFYASAAGGIINLIIIISQSKTSGKIEESFQIDEELPVAPEIKRMYLHIAWIANFASWFTLGIMRNLAPELMLKMGIRASTFGNLMLINGISQTLMFLFLGTSYPRRWHYRLSSLLAFQFIGIAAFFFIWVVTNIPLWTIAFFAIGTTTGMTYFSSIYYSLHGHTDKGNKSGLHEAILGSGALLGPFLGGALADFRGIKSPFLLCTVVILLSIMGQIYVSRRRARGQEG